MAEKRGVVWKLFKLFLFLGILFGAIYLFREQILGLLEKNPVIWAIFGHIKNQVLEKTLLGLFYATFFGGLFFISLPVEVIFIIYLNLEHNIFLVVLIAFIGNMLGMIVNYGIGRLVGKKILHFFLKESYDKFQEYLNKSGGALVLFGNVFFLPMELISVFLGATHYSFKRFVIYTAIGKLGRFYLVYAAQSYFLEEVIPKIQKLI